MVYRSLSFYSFLNFCLPYFCDSFILEFLLDFYCLCIHNYLGASSYLGLKYSSENIYLWGRVQEKESMRERDVKRIPQFERNISVMTHNTLVIK